MFDIVKSDRVYYGGNKWVVAGVSDREVKLKDVRGWPYVPRDAVKPVIRLTPLVRARMLIEAVRDYVGNKFTGASIPKVLYPVGVSVSTDHYFKVCEAVSLIQSIGGYEAAQLYTDCDGYVNGSFIRGDDVRRALRILEGL